jgi:hypothetical protein
VFGVHESTIGPGPQWMAMLRSKDENRTLIISAWAWRRPSGRGDSAAMISGDSVALGGGTSLQRNLESRILPVPRINPPENGNQPHG